MTKNLVTEKLLLILALLIVSCSFIYAADFSVTYTPKTDTIYGNEIAYYSFSITNTGLTDDRIQIYTISATWDLSQTLISIPKQNTVDFILEITPLDNKLTGPYLVPLTIKSLSTGKIETLNVYLYVKASNATVLEYIPNVKMDVNVNNGNSEIDPRQKIPIEISLENRNPLDIKELKILIISDLFNKEFTTTLSPLDRKTNQILFELDPFYPPGKHTINVKILKDNQTINEANKEVEILSYSDIDIEQMKVNGFLSSTETITLINHGNYEAIKQIKVPMGFFQKTFTTTSVKYISLNENGINYISWNVPLTPEDKEVIVIKTNYSILLIIALIIIALIILYYIFRSPVLLYKKAKIVTSTEEGTSEIKVKLHIRNRSGKIIKNIKIMDKYPKITEVEAESVLGTTAPTKLLSADKTSSILMWTLESLEPYEERLFTYKLKSHLKIIGNINLPEAKVKFLTKTGERSYMSDGVYLFHKSEKPVGEFIPVEEIVKKK